MFDFKNNFLFFVAHPDDEVLGCGGIIQKILSSGGKVTICFASLGYGKYKSKKIGQIKNCLSLIENSKKNKITVIHLNLKGLYLDTYPKSDLNLKFFKIINKVKPEYIFTHHPGDMNHDHKSVFEAVYVNSRYHKASNKIKGLFTFETLSSTEWKSFIKNDVFIPNVYIKLSKKQIEIKQNAFKKYITEVMDYPHPRSKEGIINLARYRGQTFSTTFAESFHMVRLFVD